MPERWRRGAAVRLYNQGKKKKIMIKAKIIAKTFGKR
jgi:hypothetical protein